MEPVAIDTPRKKRPGFETEMRTAKERILQTAVKLLQRQGFHNTSVDQIISEAMVSKGNFFHHFKNKEELGFAVIESIRAELAKDLAEFLSDRAQSPLERLFQGLEQAFQDREKIKRGSPIGRLAQELSDEGFRKKINEIYEMWAGAYERLFEEAKLLRELRQDANCHSLALFWMSNMEGAMLLARTYQDPAAVKPLLEEMRRHVEAQKR